MKAANYRRWGVYGLPLLNSLSSLCLIKPNCIEVKKTLSFELSIIIGKSEIIREKIYWELYFNLNEFRLIYENDNSIGQRTIHKLKAESSKLKAKD